MIDFFPPRERMPEPNQFQAIHEYNKTHRKPFNPVFFERTDQQLVESMKKAILSCQRLRGFFTIQVTGFDVEYDVEKIDRILYDYYEEKNAKKTKSKRVNPMSCINLKDSAFFLMIVHYHVTVAASERNPAAAKDFDVLIELPRIVDKYYYRISGNYYLALYQIVDGSTYNNTASNSSKQFVTSRTLYPPTLIYRTIREIKTSLGENLKIIHYTSHLFAKTFPLFLFYFAKSGVWNTINFFEIGQDWDISFNDLSSDFMYSFETKCGIHINVPKILFDKDIITQSMVFTLYKQFNNEKHGTLSDAGLLEQVLSPYYWIRVLAEEFAMKLYPEKGEQVLISFESILDLITQDDLHLPEEDKATVYHYCRWLLREFPELRKKDISDISYKKLKLTDSIAAIHTYKTTTGIFLASDAQSNITIKDVIAYVYTEPDYLLTRMIKEKNIAFKNTVNDIDAIMALKFSYKGVSGLNDQKGSSIPKTLRYVHPSHLGRVDPDASSATDPGITGMLCPYGKLYGNSFEEYKEPDTWRDNYHKLLEKYREAKSTLEINKVRESLSDIFPQSVESLENAAEDIELSERLIMLANEEDGYIIEEDSEDDDDDELENDGFLEADISEMDDDGFGDDDF